MDGQERVGGWDGSGDLVERMKPQDCYGQIW